VPAGSLAAPVAVHPARGPATDPYSSFLCYGPARQRRTIGRGAMIEFLKEFWRFLRVRKKFWLFPIVVIMGLLGGIFVLTKGSVVAPFIYVLF
jgi:hypothetical protein